jgi:hypothetical protein
MLAWCAAPGPASSRDQGKSSDGMTILDYAQALVEIEKPETREAAADTLVGFARTHPGVQNHVAQVLASRNTHLDDAEIFATQSVERIERATGAVAGSPVTPPGSSEYWDSLGWVRFAQGDAAAAKRYCLAAWRLGGEGLYLGHVAQIAAAAGDQETARRLLQVAMSGTMDRREQEQTAKELEQLGVKHPAAIPETEVIPVERVDGMLSPADVYVVFVANDKPRVRWIGDREGPPAEERAIMNAKYPDLIPDSGPEHVVRHGHLTCNDAGCSLTLAYASLAVPERRSRTPGAIPAR